MKDLKTTRGMPDLYDEDVERISIVENICLETFKSFNFQEFRTPIVENKTLFQRSVGESSDIIQKEVSLSELEEIMKDINETKRLKYEEEEEE